MLEQYLINSTFDVLIEADMITLVIHKDLGSDNAGCTAYIALFIVRKPQVGLSEFGLTLINNNFQFFGKRIVKFGFGINEVMVKRSGNVDGNISLIPE